MKTRITGSLVSTWKPWELQRVERCGLITILGSIVLWPLVGHTQPPERMRRIGMLLAYPENNPFTKAYVAAFTQALERFGWVEGKNIRIDYRFAAGDPALFKHYAAELVSLAPDAILASTAPALAALQQQTRTIPIVFVIVPDPVGRGLVTSLARPGGNITGFASYNASIIAKWVQLLKEAAPGVVRASIIFNPNTALAPPLDSVIRAAPSMGIIVTLAPVHDAAGIEEATAAQAREPGGGLIVLPDSFNVTHSSEIVTAAIRFKLPSIGWTEFCRAGGLMSYWYDAVELHSQAASYIDRILRGASPAELPVQYPTKYSLIVNLKTARAIGLIIRSRLLSESDEVIE